MIANPSSRATNWLLLQLADSSFPAGGFAHSSGLEALVQAGVVRDGRAAADFARDVVWQTTRGSLPLVSAAVLATDDLTSLDALADSYLWSDVANRASRVQGRAFLDSAARSFAMPALTSLRARAQAREIRAHFAPTFGACAGSLGLSSREAREVFLHTSLRGALSAAVRLGVIGPHEAQSIHLGLHPVLDEALSHSETLGLDDLAQTSPVAELLQGTHDRLYSRLFQS